VEEKTMKRKVSTVIGMAAIAIIIVFIVAWMAPRNFLEGVKAENVAMISVRDGSNGNNVEITIQEDIIFIVGKIQSQSFKKDGVSMFHMGTLYTMRFFDSDNRLVEEFILNSDDTIRKDPFFYKTDPELDGLTEYIKNCFPGEK